MSNIYTHGRRPLPMADDRVMRTPEQVARARKDYWDSLTRWGELLGRVKTLDGFETVTITTAEVR